MIILGIDPGTAITGYAVITKNERTGDPILIDAGSIQPEAREQGERLKAVRKALLRLLDIHSPRVIALEKIFFSKNIRTALAVAEARGVFLLTAAERSIKVCEYTPGEVKMAVAGYGKADKHQVKEMTRLILKQATIPALDDVTDAIAIALTALQANKKEK